MKGLVELEIDLWPRISPRVQQNRSRPHNFISKLVLYSSVSCPILYNIVASSDVSTSFYAQSNVLITWPSSNCTWCFIQTRYRTLNEWFMTVLLTHRYHCMLACRNCFLTYRPVARDITWIHAGIIRTLQSTFISRTFFKLSRTVSARRYTSQVKCFWRCAISYDSFVLA